VAFSRLRLLCSRSAIKQGTITPIKANRSKLRPAAPAGAQLASTLALSPPVSVNGSGEIMANNRKGSFTTAISEDAILVRIENGESIAAISASMGAYRSTLSIWLNANEHRSARERGPHGSSGCK
jgi:hypothetical protein